MKNFEEISISDYSYNLPEYRIARFPLPERDLSKLLVYKNGNIQTDTFRNLSEVLNPDSVLIFNDTKVDPVRIFFDTGKSKPIEIFCLEPAGNIEITTAFNARERVLFNCMVGNLSKWKSETISRDINIADEKLTLTATKKTVSRSEIIIEFSWNNNRHTFAGILENAGETPLPPYLKRRAGISDYERYQTIYAKHRGSVAAPTAGLHFTEKTFHDLRNKNIDHFNITLHVGAGTFLPVKSEKIINHEMHAERVEISRSLLETLADNLGKKKLIQVGTTSLRTVESIYWLGVKIIKGGVVNHDRFFVDQWAPYRNVDENISVQESLESLISYLSEAGLEKIFFRTQLMILPGYKFRLSDALITNFHQPKSTLLLLVAAYIGADWRKVYDYALQNDFRFLSYGDGSILFRNKS